MNSFVSEHFYAVILASISALIISIVAILYWFCFKASLRGEFDLEYDRETGKPFNRMKISMSRCCGRRK